MGKRQKSSEHTVAETITATLPDGRVISGTLWLHPSGRGSFKVSYGGVTKTNGRKDYMSAEHIRSIAKTILREMAEADR